MITLNNAPLEFKVFPNGESYLDLEPDLIQDENIVTLKFESDSDLLHLQFLKDELDARAKNTSLLMPYMPYGRMDRREEKRLFTLKSIAEMINGMGFSSVEIWEPHSKKTTELINHAYIVNKSRDLALKEIKHLIKDKELAKKDICIVFPDKGAAERYDGLEFPTDIVKCSKSRDFNTGNILEVKFPNDKSLSKKYRAAIIIDDLCSKGGTFLLTAEALKNHFPELQYIYLAVTHCENTVFSGALLTNGLIDGVYTTNSILDYKRFCKFNSIIAKNSYIEDISQEVIKM